MRKKSAADRMVEAVRVGACLVGIRRSPKLMYELRHGKVPEGSEVRLSCGTRGCVLDAHHFMRPRLKTARQCEMEATTVGACLVHPSKGCARRVYQLRHGLIPSSVCVCHKCDVRQCILDAHHFPGTQLDNVQDMKRKNRQRSPEWTPEMRARRAQISKAMWSDPAWGANQRQAIKSAYAAKVWSPDDLRKRSEAAKIGWSRTAKRARNTERTRTK